MPIIEMLIHAQARATAKDANDQTPLHCAARNGRVEAVRCLMEAAYDQRVVDSAEKNEMKNSGSCRARATRKRRKVVYIEGIGDIGYDSDEEEDEDLGGVTYLDEAIRKGHR